MTGIEDLTGEPQIAYFSMEIGLSDDIPTYSGGLGVLAGDTIRSAADLNLPMVAVTLIARKGYFRQELDGKGRQSEHFEEWDPADKMTLHPKRVSVIIEGRVVVVQAWVYNVTCPVTKWRIPIFFLDTDVPENDPRDRVITDSLNEGDASLLTLELLKLFKRDIEEVWDERQVWDTERVRDLCVFTTHTPVEAGHDKFPYELVSQVLGEVVPLDVLRELGGQDRLNMTLLAMNLSKYINGVAKKHGEGSKER